MCPVTVLFNSSPRALQNVSTNPGVVLYYNVQDLPRFSLRNGSDWVLVQTHPAHPALGYDHVRRPDRERCARYLGNMLYFVSERELLCEEQRSGDNMVRQWHILF